MDEIEMYKSGMSIPEVSKVLGIPLSTLRFRLNSAGVLRSRAEGVRLAASKGRIGDGLRGKRRVFTDEWKKNISKAKTDMGLGKGFRTTQSGYIEFTRGPNKGRMEHVVLMEEAIGRRLNLGECVHHLDHNRSNNDMSNLVLMTRSEHAKLHAEENLSNRIRDDLGRFK